MVLVSHHCFCTYLHLRSLGNWDQYLRFKVLFLASTLKINRKLLKFWQVRECIPAPGTKIYRSIYQCNKSESPFPPLLSVIQREDDKYHSCKEIRRTAVAPVLDCQVQLWDYRNYSQVRRIVESLTQSEPKFQMFLCWEAELQPDTVYYLSWLFILSSTHLPCL